MSEEVLNDMSDTMSDMMSDTMTTTSNDTSDDTSNELHEMWSEALKQCEQVEKLHTDIILQSTAVHQSLISSDRIMVTYEGVNMDLMDVLNEIHKKTYDHVHDTIGSILLSTLDKCEFKP